MLKKLRLAYLTRRHRLKAYRNPASPNFGSFSTNRSRGIYAFGVTFQCFDNFADYFYYPLNGCRTPLGRKVTHVPVEIHKLNSRSVWFRLPDGNTVNCKMARIRFGYQGQLPR